MIINDRMSTDLAREELSKRFKQYRIAYPMTQEDLEEKSMVSLSTIKRFENGEDISLSKFIQLINALDLQGHLEVLIPDQLKRPSAFLRPRPRQRARKKKEMNIVWKWGDEE